MSAVAALTGSKLQYFGVPGRGEAVRFVFRIAGIAFEDERISFPQWGALKGNTPFGSMPVLTLPTGDVLSNQRAILRFLGKKTNLYPTDDLQAGHVDELMDALDDLGVKANSCGAGLTGDEKLAKRAEGATADGVVGQHFQRIDEFIAKYGSNGFCVGDSLTIADLLCSTATSMVSCGFYDGIPLDTIERYPHVQDVRKQVANHPAIREYYDSRGELSNAEKFIINNRD